MLLLMMLACSKPPECPEPPPADRVLDASEAALIKPYLEELRQGIQLVGDQGFGICQGKRSCDTFLGLEPPPLEAGDYLVRAELGVPELGEGWKVKFKIDCDLTTAEGKTSHQNHEKVYDVRHVRTPDMGYRLQPLWMIQSPHPNGSRTCAFSLTPIRPDGAEGTPWTGRYTTAAPTEAEAPAAAQPATKGKDAP